VNSSRSDANADTVIVEQVFGIVKRDYPKRRGGRLNSKDDQMLWSFETFAARFRGWVREGRGSVPSLAQRFRSGQQCAETREAGTPKRSGVMAFMQTLRWNYSAAELIETRSRD
jgi:hypothetical protein